MAQKQKKTDSKSTGKSSANEKVGQVNFVFSRKNYTLMVIGFVVVVLGFILMYGKEGDIYDFRRTTLAPLTVLAGFVIVGLSIFKSSKEKDESA